MHDLSITGVEWMSAPQAVTGAPPGLEYLGALDQIIVKQRVELLESKCLLIEMNGMHLFLPGYTSNNDSFLNCCAKNY